MSDISDSIQKYIVIISLLGGVAAFIWSVAQFFIVRNRESRAKKFETYHRLIKELVEPPIQNGVLYIDRQCAIIFELRFLPRYFPLTRRTLLGLRQKWSDAEAQYPRLFEELDLTLQYIDSSRLKRFFE